MSLPNYLAKIKSAGMYRFTFDKSQIPAADAETMRLVVGYSDKGPFNNPVYIDNKQDFINLFGNINKRLEKKGVFFHRMALQALSAGPILALNLKPFGSNNGSTDVPEGETPIENTEESVEYITFNTHVSSDATANKADGIANINARQLPVRKLFDTNRFWKLDADQLPDKIKAEIAKDNTGYISIAATDTKEMSCTIFIRKCHANSVKQYDVTVRDWYKNSSDEMPEYLEGLEDTNIADYFGEIYVFRGQFSESLMTGALKDYFDSKAGTLSTTYINQFTGETDALAALAADENSNFLGLYRGSLLPYFKDMNGNYVSLDILFNGDKDIHKMIMKLDDSQIDGFMEDGLVAHKIACWPNNTGWLAADPNTNSALTPIYVKGYEYNTISRYSTALQIYNGSLGMLVDKGIYAALTNHVDSEYHYIIDTFATLIDSCTIGAKADIGAKANIAAVAKAKDNCLAIMNFPSMDYFSKTISRFDLNNLKQYVSLPSEVNGASYCAFYTPLVFGEGAVKSIIPSAALVSNNFMEKWNSRQPYYIVAGPNYGRMDYENLIGPDYNYSREDLDILEPFGVNCMVYVPRKGTYINSNQTAKQVPVSALSKVHVRELVIYVQNEIERMLQNYQWELNTQTLRDTIKTSADTILERIKSNGGVYDYINVCDGSNNTPEVIDNEMVILDTSIEPARGAGKMVQRLTIHKTGGISSLTM